jgi:hypothetical protein
MITTRQQSTQAYKLQNRRGDRGLNSLHIRDTTEGAKINDSYNYIICHVCTYMTYFRYFVR